MISDNWNVFFEKTLGDALLQEISWHNAEDLHLRFVITTKREISLNFLHVRELNIDLTFGDLTGLPLIFEAKVSENRNYWEVMFDFGGAPNGCISFLCEKIELNPK